MKSLSFSSKQLYVVAGVTLFITCVLAAPQIESEQETEPNSGERVEEDDRGIQRDDKVLIAFVPIEASTCTSNDPTGSDGICMTSKGCKDKGGTPAGTCSNGLGTCCLMTRSCETQTVFNHTRFISPLTDGIGACSLTVHRQNSDICQIRLDFISFQLSQPDSDGNCNTDFFTVTGGTNNIPIICGDNTGQHLYVNVEANGGPIKMTVDRSTTASSSRNWNIKITQIECNSRYRAPGSCLQYFTATSGTVQSFNFNNAAPTTDPGTRQLADQEYGICIQRAPGYCGIVWERDTTEDSVDGGYSFSVSENTDAVLPGLPGNPVAGGKGDGCTTDYVGIPGGIDDTNVQSDRYCGQGFPLSVTSTSTPFALYVKTDANETADGNNRGFKLNYRQKTSC